MECFMKPPIPVFCFLYVSSMLSSLARMCGFQVYGRYRDPDIVTSRRRSAAFTPSRYSACINTSVVTYVSLIAARAHGLSQQPGLCFVRPMMLKPMPLENHSSGFLDKLLGIA